MFWLPAGTKGERAALLLIADWREALLLGTRGWGTTGGHQVTSDTKVFARPFIAMRERSAEIIFSQSAEISGVVLFFEDLLCSGDQFSSRGIIPLAGKRYCLDESHLNNKKDGDTTAVTDKCLWSPSSYSVRSLPCLCCCVVQYHRASECLSHASIWCCKAKSIKEQTAPFLPTSLNLVQEMFPSRNNDL